MIKNDDEYDSGRIGGSVIVRHGRGTGAGSNEGYINEEVLRGNRSVQQQPIYRTPPPPKCAPKSSAGRRYRRSLPDTAARHYYMSVINDFDTNK